MKGVEIGDFIGLMFLGLVLAIGLLGFFVLGRLHQEGRPAPRPIAQAVFAVLFFAIALMSTFMPPLALVPALLFSIFGLRLLFGGASRRDGGIVMALLVVAWWFFMKFQASTLASGADIRVDLIFTLPIMTAIGTLGWRIYATEP